MSNYVLLNNIAHKNLKVIQEHSPKYGDDVASAITFPEEFRSVQGVYPIFFHKDGDTGNFFPVAIFGFRENENLFLNGNGWDAQYIPLSIKRRPFLIGFQNVHVDGAIEKNMVVHVDMDSTRLSESDGEAIFLPHGGHSAYLEKMVTILDYMSIGNITGENFVKALLEYELLESCTLDIELRNGESYKMLGFYTINEDRLKTLDVKIVGELHSEGYLEYIYMVLASMTNMHNLIQRIENKISSNVI